MMIAMPMKIAAASVAIGWLRFSHSSFHRSYGVILSMITNARNMITTPITEYTSVPTSAAGFRYSMTVSPFRGLLAGKSPAAAAAAAAVGARAAALGLLRAV